MIKIHSLYQIRSFSCLHFVDYELSDVFHMLANCFLYKSFTIIFVVVSVLIIISLSFYHSCFSYYSFIIIILFIFILNITHLPKYVAQSTFETKRASLEREKKTYLVMLALSTSGKDDKVLITHTLTSFGRNSPSICS